MAAKPHGGSSVQSELRIVIVGNAGDEKDKVVKSVLNCENLTGKSFGLCSLHQCEQAGRRISVVEAPGWDRSSEQQTPEIIEEEVVRSVSICPPGPHALLLVIPVKVSEEPSRNEIAAAQTHMQLLSERVWKHTILLFVCEDAVEETLINEHIHSAETILEKYGRRSHVLQKSACQSPAQIHELLRKIDYLVEENRGDFFIPQAYYELIQHKTEEASGKREIRRRRRSLDNPPNLNKEKGGSGEKKETVAAAKPTAVEEMPKIIMDFRQFVVILMGVIGALIGAVAGAETGVSGSCSGIVFGAVVGILLASLLMCIYTHVYSRSYPNKPTQHTT